MPLCQPDVKDIRALNLPLVLSRGSSHQVKRVIASHSDYQITSLPLFQAHSNGVVSFQMPKSRSDLSSGYLCFLHFSLCHFCVIFRHGSRAMSVVWGDTILHQSHHDHHHDGNTTDTSQKREHQHLQGNITCHCHCHFPRHCQQHRHQTEHHQHQNPQ